MSRSPEQRCFMFCSTVLRCQTLFPPPNGFLVEGCDNSYGSTCRMSCDDGYNLLGSEILTCLHKPGHITGYWNESIPTCESERQIVCNLYTLLFGIKLYSGIHRPIQIGTVKELCHRFSYLRNNSLNRYNHIIYNFPMQSYPFCFLVYYLPDDELPFPETVFQPFLIKG